MDKKGFEICIKEFIIYLSIYGLLIQVIYPFVHSLFLFLFSFPSF